MIVRNKIPDEEKESGSSSNSIMYTAMGLFIAVIVGAFFIPCTLYMNNYKTNSYYSQQQHQGAALQSCKVSLQIIGSAVEKYKKENGEYPKKINDLVPKYLTNIPACSISTAGLNYINGYQYKNKKFKLSAYKYPGKEFKYNFEVPDCYTVFCSGSNHINAGLPPNFPQYSSKNGMIEK